MTTEKEQMIDNHLASIKDRLMRSDDYTVTLDNSMTEFTDRDGWTHVTPEGTSMITISARGDNPQPEEEPLVKPDPVYERGTLADNLRPKREYDVDPATATGLTDASTGDLIMELKRRGVLDEIVVTDVVPERYAEVVTVERQFHTLMEHAGVVLARHLGSHEALHGSQVHTADENNPLLAGRKMELCLIFARKPK